MINKLYPSKTEAEGHKYYLKKLVEAETVQDLQELLKRLADMRPVREFQVQMLTKAQHLSESPS